MRNKSLLILGLITIVIIIAATISTRNRAPQVIIEKPPLSDTLKGKINDVSQIIIESSDHSVHVTKFEDDWVVMQADDYPARFDMVKKLVLNTADLYILSEKTSNPDLFRELGVEDHTAENARSTLLTLLDASGNTLSSIIIGNSRSQDGFYVRKADSINTYLVAGRYDVSADPIEWIETSLLDIPNDRIMQVTIEHPDGETLTLSRETGAEQFVLADIPEGRKSRSQYFTSQPGTFLADLSIENARSRETFRFTESQVKTIIKTYDGLVASISSAKIDNLNYVAIDFSGDDTLIGQNQAQAEDEPIIIGEQESQNIDVRGEIDQLNNKVSKWVFVVPQSKFLLLTKRTDELTDTIEQQ